MLLKRLYDPASLEAGAPKVIGLKLRHTGTDAEQNFSTELVAELIAGGLMKLEANKLTLLTTGEPLVYTVKRRPGYYCCHDGKPIPISDFALREMLTTGVGKLVAAEARAYLKAHGFEGKPSPSASSPAGYECINHFECVLDEKQHAKYKAVKGALAPSMSAAAGV
jgi:hypothetical protein